MFDLRRFLRLAAVHWAEYGRGYLWFLGIGIGVHFCVWLLVAQAGRHPESYYDVVQRPVYVAGYVLSGALFASRYFGGLSRRESALTLLMRPASNFEKFLLAFVIVGMLYPLAYTLAFQVVNLPGAWLGKAAQHALLSSDKFKENAYLVQREFGPFLPFADKQAPWLELNLFLMVSAVQALIVAGSLWFRRVAWLKTLVALFVLVVIALPLLATLVDGSPWLLFWRSNLPAGHPWLLAWLALLWLGIPSLLWASTYFFLRERELQ